MRVALVLPYNPLIERTGLQNLAVRWGRALNGLGHATTIVSLGPCGEVEGVRVAGYPSFRRVITALAGGGWDVVHWLEVWPDRVAVVVQHLASWIGHRVGGQRVFLTTETPGNLRTRGGGVLARRVARAAYGRFVVSDGEFLPEYRDFGITDDRVTIIPHALLPDEPFTPQSSAAIVDLRSRYGIVGDEPVVLYIGRLVHRKRPLDFINAVTRLAARGLRFYPLIVGDGLRHEDSADAAVAEAVRSSSVPIDLRPMSDRPADYMALSDIVVVPSERDGQAFVVLEAMASGAIPVVADVPVLRTALATDGDGRRCGLLFKAGDTAALADAIALLLTDPALRGTLRQNGIQWMRHGRDLRRVVADLVAVYGTA